MLLAIASGFLLATVAPMLNRLLGGRAGWVVAILPAGIFFYFLGFVEPISQGAKFAYGTAWLPGIGITFSFFVDGLSLLFSLLISGIGTFILIYSGGYLHGHRHLGRFYSFMLMFMASMLGLVLADNLITLFVFWELTSLTSFLLIGFDHQREAARRAAFQALVVTGAGGLAMFAGFILIAQVSGITELSVLLSAGGIIKESPLYPVIVILVLGGAFTKSAQVPFHFWLPNAMEAPTPVSAYLHSATMVKAGVYLLMRMTPILGDSILWSALLAGFGAATLLTGTLLALRQDDLKIMLAYTTVASLGLLVMLVGVGSAEALLGAILYLFAHALYKGGLFMVIGGIDHSTGTRDVTGLGGLGRVMPVTAAAAALAALSMSGIAPFTGFVAKEVMYGALADGNLPSLIVAAVAMVGNALMMAVAVVIAVKPFLGPLQATPRQPHEAPVSLWIGPVVLALVGLAAGFAINTLGQQILVPTASAVFGFLVEIELHLWGGFNAALLMSLVTIAAGIGVYLVHAHARRYCQILFDTIGWGPDKGFDQFIARVVAMSCWVMARVQSGSMSRYMLIIFLTTAAALYWPLVAGGAMPALPAWPGLLFYEWVVLGIAIIGVAAVLYAKTRLIAVVSLGIQGFAVALIFLLFGAPDLSFTQFMIETLSVVILALVLTRLKMDRRDLRSIPERLRDGTLAVLVGAGFGLALLRVTQGTLDLRLSDYFGKFSYTVAQGRNIVNVILVDFRALDTLGEITVVLVAGLAVIALIRMRPAAKPVPSQSNEGPP